MRDATATIDLFGRETWAFPFEATREGAAIRIAPRLPDQPGAPQSLEESARAIAARQAAKILGGPVTLVRL